MTEGTPPGRKKASKSFRQLGPNHVVCSRGYSVKRQERNLLVYEGPERTLHIEVEPGPTLGVYLTHSAKQLFLPDADIAAIRKDLEEALDFMGVSYEIS